MQAEFGLGSKDIVSVAVDVANEKHLRKLNQREPLAKIIKSLCSEFNLVEDPSMYALQFVYSEQESNENKYVTEENRHEIKNACILRLVLSPLEMVKLIIARIPPDSYAESEEKHWALIKLSSMSADRVFAKTFLENNGQNIITSIIISSAEKPSNIVFCLNALLYYMKYSLLPSLDDVIIDRLIEYVVSDQKLPLELVETSLDLLRQVAKPIKGIKEKIINLNISDIIQHIWNMDCPSIQEKALALINTMAQRPGGTMILGSMMSKQVRDAIYKNIISNTVMPSMAHELYVYQTLILGILQSRLKPIDPETVDIKPIKEINSVIATAEEAQCRKDNMSFVHDEDKISESIRSPDKEPLGTSGQDLDSTTTHYTRIIKKQYSTESLSKPEHSDIGKSEKQERCSLILNFSGNSKEDSYITHLTLECMHHFAQKYCKTFVRVAMEEKALSNSFPGTCDYLIRLLCDLLEVGKLPQANGRSYQPMVFTATNKSPFMEELFCRAVLLLGRTRREMRARTLEDQQKVMQVVNRQLKEALLAKPETLEQLDAELKKVPYTVIMEIWWKEQQEKENWELAHSPPILQLKKERMDTLLELIKKQRLNVLLRGAKFPKFTPRGQRVKKKCWFVCLSSNMKMIHYGDCDEEDKVLLESMNTIAVSSIHMLVIKNKCPHIIESRRRKQDHEFANLAFSLLLNEEPQNLNFIAPDQRSFDLWTDGINVLLGNEMTSATKAADLNALMDIEVRLQLLDVEDVVIPHGPPKIPPEPTNYSFYYE